MRKLEEKKFAPNMLCIFCGKNIQGGGTNELTLFQFIRDCFV